jgi:Methyltransferase domain
MRLLNDLICSIELSKCVVCNGSTKLCAQVDFNMNCEERKGFSLPRAGLNVEYHMCETCETIHAPTFDDWTPEEFSEYIYNKDYIKVDPEYVKERPLYFVNEIEKLFGDKKNQWKHLDFGGGNGLVSQILKSKGWNSRTYDPYGEENTIPNEKFSLITAFEVFEHTPDPHKTMQTIISLLDNNGNLFVSTALSDKHQNAMWWYMSPRNGHITIYTRKSISFLAKKYELNINTEFTPDAVLMYK